MSLQCLPQSTIKLIGSSQVITSVSAAVKELVENSLDAGACSIDVKLENHGMDKIEIRDDGHGISKDNVPLMCKKSYTSKISCFADLDDLRSYGFRGEALNALCAVSKLSVTTKTDEDDLAYTYQYDNNGSVKDSKPSHINKGTIILAEGLFRNLPVRRQFLTNGRRRSEEIKKVESVIKSLAIVHPRLRLTFTHNKFLIWQKNSVANLKQSLAQAIPPTIISQLDSFNFSDTSSNIEMTVLLPRKDCNISVTCFSNKDDSLYLFINSRPIRHKELEKAVEGELFQYFGHYIPANKYPLCLLSIKIPPNGLDVNLEPNKTKLIIKDSDYLIEKLKSQFLKYYTGVQDNPDAKTPVEIKLAKRKLETDHNETTSSQDNIKIPKIDNFPSDTGQQDPSCDVTIQNSSQKIISDNLENIGLPECSTGSDISKENKSPVNFDLIDKMNFDEINEINLNTRNLKSVSSNSNEDVTYESQGSSADTNTGSGHTLKSQELDELEHLLATSSHSSLVVTPELNGSLDCFGMYENSSSQMSNGVNSEILDVNIENKLNSCNDDNIKSDNISEFLSGLPVRQTDEGCDDFPVNNKKTDFDIIGIAGSDFANGKNTKTDAPDLDSISLSQWSKGHVLGATNVPIMVKPDSHINQDNFSGKDDSSFHHTENLMAEELDADSSQMDRSVSSQMGCKNMAAFTKFAKEMRTRIIQQQPGISFTRVASELASKWRDLADDEKKEYQELANKEKAQSKEKKVQTPEPKLKQPTIKPKASEPPKGLKKVKYDKVVDVNVTIDALKNRMDKLYLSENTFSQIIGKCSDDLYFYTSENDLSALSALRLNEVINYYKNMSTMSVPLKVLENNIPIKPEDIGEKNWHTLQCLETSVDLKNNTIIISNELITKNGFRIEVIDGIEGRKFEITDVPTHVSYYGVNELKEILDVMDKHGTTGTLLDCRPLKIVSYIRSETIRTCSTSQFNFDSKGRDSMFNFWIKNVQKVYPKCPHHKPVAKELYTFREIVPENT